MPASKSPEFGNTGTPLLALLNSGVPRRQPAGEAVLTRCAIRKKAALNRQMAVPSSLLLGHSQCKEDVAFSSAEQVAGNNGTCMDRVLYRSLSV